MRSILQSLRKLQKTDITAIVLLASAFIFLFIMASFNGTISDEAFYITIPLRIMNGDGLFTDEWHLSQLSSVLLYLPVRFFVSLTGGTQGIILFMRRLFCLMQLAVGAFTYKTFRKEGLSAAFISISFMLFSVIGLNTLSYNTMGVALLLVIICLTFTLFERPSPIRMFLLGSLIAMLILCQPFGIIFYAIYFIAVCAFNIRGIKNKREAPYPFTAKSFIMTVLGILPVLVFFLYLLLKNSDIETIISCIPGILSDVEHMEISDTLGIETFSAVQFFTDMTMAAGLIPLIIFAVCAASAFIIKRKNKNAAIIIAGAGLAIFSLIFYYRLLFANGTTETDDINFFFLPLALSGIVFYVLSDKKNHKVFILFWGTGILYAVFMTVSSNLRLHASVNGYILAAAGSVILANDLLKEIKAVTPNKKLSEICAGILITAVFGFTVFNTFATACISVISRASFQSAKMTQGIYAEITLPSDQALIYTNLHNDAEAIKELTSADDRIFVSENIPAMYLEGSFNMGAFSGWFIAEQLAFPEIRNRFREYYDLFPENIPDYIYVPAYIYTETGLAPVPPKMMSDFAFALFDGKARDIGSGLLITVTGIKDEQA